MNGDGASLIIIEESENSHDALSSVFVSEFSCDCIKKLIEVDSSHVVLVIKIGDHFIDRGVFIFKS